MKAYYLAVILSGISSQIFAQNVSLENLEAAFLQKNYLLIASKYEVDKIDAEIIQTKLWNNPSLSISEVNLWKTYNVEEQPYLLGKYGKNQQLSVDLEQLIETAGKRKKRVAVKELEKNKALFDYEELLRQLKKDLRQSYFSLAKFQEQEIQLNESIDLFSQLVSQYKKQADLKNVPKADFFRLQTELISLQKEKIELENNQTELLTKLKVFTQNKELKLEEIDFSNFKNSSRLIPFNVLEIAAKQNTGLKRQGNEINIAEKQLILEKAQKTPDLTLQLGYDRGGNIMRDFVGVGVSFDLPIFDRNKGNIKAAEISIIQQKITQEAIVLQLDNSVNNLQNQLNSLQKSLINWQNFNQDDQLSMIENYKKHLQSKQVTMLEFIDFTQAYRESQQAYLDLLETYQNTFEELNYIVGQDL